MSRFADVIVPFPLPSLFTYLVPQDMANRVGEGSRVIVPFGPRRYYTAVVRRLHDTAPPGDHELKTLTDVLDAQPLLSPEQLKLWDWMADYYLCTPGDVCRAALPAGLRLESETCVSRNPDFVGQLTQRELRILAFLPQDQERNATKLEKLSGLHDILPTLKSLLDKDAIRLYEQIRPTHTPRKEAFFSLAAPYQDPERLQDTLKTLERRAPLQFLALVQYLEVAEQTDETTPCPPPSQTAPGTHTDASCATETAQTYSPTSTASSSPSGQVRPLYGEVARPFLLRRTGTTATALVALVNRGILTLTQRQTNSYSPLVAPTPLTPHTQTLTEPTHTQATQPLDAPATPFPLQPLTPPQQQAYQAIRQAFDNRDICLLHGVTGSGKTEIYIHLMADALARGEQVLYLLPEIALTTQITHRLQRIFGTRLGVYHSRFTDAQRVDVWRRQSSPHSYDIILGVRSSIFLPFNRLGLVIIDEEHEPSYKQQAPAPRYHGRNAALVLAALHHAKTLLGTATPSLETWHLAQTGKYALVTLTQRHRNIPLPEVITVDVRKLRRKRLMPTPFSPALIKAMRQAFDQGQQVILFQNRRGYAQMVECHTCGWVPRCPQCDVSLTYHKQLGQLTCHYCGYTMPLPRKCPACQGTDLRHRGLGTERIEDDLQELLPNARLARMDLDTTRSRAAYERIIDDFEHGRTDILIGTQMVSKGLDFDQVSVVGILDADCMLTYPDFRSYERAFQLMAQVAGRSGRRDRRGLVVLQTRNVDLPIIAQVSHNDYEGMARAQLAERQAFAYPPFTRLVYVYLKHGREDLLDQVAQALATRLRTVFGRRVLGPDRPPVARIQALYIRRIVLKVEVDASMARARRHLRQAHTDLLASDPHFASVQVYYDVDPV